MLLAVIIMTSMLSFTSCDPTDPDPDPDPILVEDGMYIVGDATALTELKSIGMMSVTKNEVTQELRNTLMEMYIAVKATGGFNIINISGQTQTVYGPGADFAIVAEADLDGEEPREGLWKGTYTETETQFTVPEDGLYHVMLDTELGKVAIARVKWGLIGGATPGGWGDNTEMTATFDLNKMDFIVEEVTMLENEYKFRYSNGWKIILDTELDLGGGDKGVKVNTNFGGALNNLEAGGDNITQATYAVYKYTLTWELGEGSSAVEEYVREGEVLPEYPEAMYLVGAATAYGWDDPATHENAIMHKIAGGGDNEGIFWKILHLEGGQGFKISAAGWADPNLGYSGVNEFDTEGVTVSDVESNMSVAESGMYMVVLDLRNDMVKVSVKAAEVYGIGETFGANDWAEDAASCLFTIDNTAKTLTSPALTADGKIRIYANHAWIPAWWNSEFNVFDGVILYRNDGGDQDVVNGTTGQIVTLTFDDNTGTIQ